MALSKAVHCKIILLSVVVMLSSCAKNQNTPNELPGNSALGLITHPIVIGKHQSASLSQSDANRMLEDGSQILNQCNSVFSQRGSVRNLSSLPSVINSETDMQRACSAASASEAGILGVPRKLQVVNSIRWCGSTGTGIIGCAYTPGECLVVRRFTASEEGILLAHEFGHSKGLPHNESSTNNVMYPSIGSDRIRFSSNECRSIRRLGLTTTPYKIPKFEYEVVKKSIEDFARESYPGGIPYNLARQYSSSDLNRIIPWLENKAEIQYWSNVVSLVGVIAPTDAYTILNAFIFSPGSGKLSFQEYEARFAAIMSMGYILKSRTDNNALKFLRDFSTPQAWNAVQWTAPYHNSVGERNRDLASAAILGLDIGGQTQALNEILKGYKPTFVEDNKISITDRVLEVINSL